jgi:hypothetical protein
MSADAGAAAPATTADTGGASTDAGGGYTPPTFGTVGDIRDALDFHDIEDLAPEVERPGATDETADELAAQRDEKGRFVKGDGDEPDKVAAKDDDDVATVKAIEARAKARRQQREAARRQREAKAKPPAPAPAPQPARAAAKPPEPAAPARDLGPVESVVRDVLAQIDKLASGDADAAAAADGSPAPDTAERTAQLAAITAKLDELKKSIEPTEEGKKQLVDLQEQVRALESDRVIRRAITTAINSVADECPTLLDPKALRTFNKEHGTTYTDAVEMIGAAATRYFEKFKKAPDLALLAKRIESRLTGASPEQTETDEKPTLKSRTVSRSDGSPPATRGRDDERSHEEAIAEFNRRMGLDQ